MKKQILNKKKYKIKKNKKMEETNGQILRIIINFDAFDGKIINIKLKNIEHQAQQFKKKKMYSLKTK